MSSSLTKKVELTILGSGTSQGVPMVGCDCEVCRSNDSKDNRTRSSIYISAPEVCILVDTSPELRTQILREKITRVDAVLMTHIHSDHVMGFDDLRGLCATRREGHMMPIYGSKQTLDYLAKTFSYAFDPEQQLKNYVEAEAHEVNSTFSLGQWKITPLELPHGRFLTYGYLFERGGKKKLAYVNDCKSIPQEVHEKIKGAEVLIVDGLRDKPNPSHMTIGEAIEQSKIVGAGCSYIIHLTHEKTHSQREKEMPAGVKVTYDGLRISLD